MPYPTNLDSFTSKTDGVSDVLAADINNLQVAVAALQTKVGIDNSTVDASIDRKTKRLFYASNGVERGFLKDDGSWAFYSNNAGQIWSATYGWLHDKFMYVETRSMGGINLGRLNSNTGGNCGNIPLNCTSYLTANNSGGFDLYYNQYNCVNCNCDCSNCVSGG